MLKKLGSGGSKTAYQMSNDDSSVLMLPNEIGYWDNMVEQEVYVSQAIQCHGLLTSDNQKVNVYLSSNSSDFIPAYTTYDFKYLAKHENYVMERGGGGDSTYKGGYFTSEQDMANNVKKWNSLLSEFLEDVRKIYQIGLPVGGDSFNFLITSEGGNLKLRYFGFDFSSKQGFCLKLKGQQKLTIRAAKRAMSYAMEAFIELEYGKFIPKIKFIFPEDYIDPLLEKINLPVGPEEFELF